MGPTFRKETWTLLRALYSVAGLGDRGTFVSFLMGGGTGGTGGTGPPQTFQRIILCLWAVHGKNRLQMVLVPQSSRRGATLVHFFPCNAQWSQFLLCGGATVTLPPHIMLHRFGSYIDVESNAESDKHCTGTDATDNEITLETETYTETDTDTNS